MTESKKLGTDWRAFRRDVDKAVSKQAGLGINCLPDVDFLGYFPDEEVEPGHYNRLVTDAAIFVLEENGYPFTEETDDE